MVLHILPSLGYYEFSNTGSVRRSTTNYLENEKKVETNFKGESFKKKNELDFSFVPLNSSQKCHPILESRLYTQQHQKGHLQEEFFFNRINLNALRNYISAKSSSLRNRTI